MIRSNLRVALVATTVLLILGLAAPAHAAKYRYGKYRQSAGSQGQGFFLFLDAGLTNPRNTDNVVVTVESAGSFNPIIPRWGDDLAGRLGGGYRWADGNKLQVSYWSFSGETVANTSGAALGGNLHFTIGPPVAGGNVGGPGTIDLTTEVTASTADVAWGKNHELTDQFGMEWSIGLRYANFEETHNGLYGELAGGTYTAAKSNEGEMFGARAAVRAMHRFSDRFSVSGGLGFSLLDGENIASSGLTPLGATSPTTSSYVSDDGRSGRILDLDVALNYHMLQDTLRISLGWEQSSWDGIAADLLRTAPNTSVTLRDRDSVAFSAYKLGVLVNF